MPILEERHLWVLSALLDWRKGVEQCSALHRYLRIIQKVLHSCGTQLLAVDRLLVVDC